MSSRYTEVVPPIDLVDGYSVGLSCYFDITDTRRVEYSASLNKPNNTTIWTEVRIDPKDFIQAMADMREMDSGEDIEEWIKLSARIRRLNFRERIERENFAKLESLWKKNRVFKKKLK